MSNQGTFNLAVEHHRAGRWQAAEQMYRQILSDDPIHAEAWHLLGFMAHQLGKNEIALDYISHAVRLSENQATFHHNLGDTHRALRRSSDAAACYRRALELNPNLMESLNNLGLVLQEQGKLEEAAACYRQALTLAPGDWDIHNNLGNTLREQQRVSEAIASYQRAIELNPDYAEAYTNLGNAFKDEGRLPEAMTFYQRALELKPDLATGHTNLGIALAYQGKLEEAIASFKRGLQCDPNSAAAYNNLGMALREQGNPDAALACHQRAVELDPHDVKLRLSLGNTHAQRDNLEEAIACFQQALQLNPTHAETYVNMGQTLTRQGRLAEALTYFEKAQALAPRDGLKIRMAMMLPAIPQARAEIDKWRGRFQESLTRLEREPLALVDPITEIGATNFFLAYQGLNDRDLQTQMARLYARACPALLYVAPHCQQSPSPRPPARPLRIGFLSGFFYDHSVSRHFAGIARHLARADFRVILLGFAGREDALTQSIRGGADEVVTLTRQMKLDALHKLIGDQQLDILYYTDIGMDHWTYFLAFARLAPVQCVGPGHPVTTGIPTIDYFISSTGLEPADGAEHYSERLVRLRNIPNYFTQPELSGPRKSRGDFGLGDDVHLYLCVQVLFKIHPDFDDLAAAILRADPKGRLVLIEARHSEWTKLLMKRLRRGMPDVYDRVLFLPRQGYENYLQLLSLADALLDTPHFSGGTTSFQALGLGAPVVTLPARYARGRPTYACYERIGVHDCVAADNEDYVRIALRLAADPEWREQMRQKVLSSSSVLFENQEVVRELEQFFKKVSGPFSGKVPQ